MSDFKSVQGKIDAFSAKTIGLFEPQWKETSTHDLQVASKLLVDALNEIAAELRKIEQAQK